MLIDCMSKIFDSKFYQEPAGKIVEIKNSERDEELKKVFVDFTDCDRVLYIRPEPPKNASICNLFQRSGNLMKACDGIILAEKNGMQHVVFCELKSSWNPKAILQIRNTLLLYDYAQALAKEWLDCNDTVAFRYSILCRNGLPVIKHSTGVSSNSIPNYLLPSKIAKEPQRILLADGLGQSSSKPLKLITMLGK